MSNNHAICRAIINSIPETAVFAEPPKLQEIYIPPAHEKSLKLYSNLIIGARGVGKSFWTLALAEEEIRHLLRTRISELENTIVRIGFAVKDDPSSYPTAETFIRLLKKKYKPYEIWQAIVSRWLVSETDESMPTQDWEASTVWARENPEPWARILQKANASFKLKNRNGLIIFDALDRTGNNWKDMNEIVRALLILVLRLKSYTNIHAKVFLREDQFSPSVTDFPDASKLLATKTELTWQQTDLHGLLWQLFCNTSGKNGDILRMIYQDCTGKRPSNHDGIWFLDDEIRWNIEKQRRLFEKLAGPWMGKDKRRGVPYVWSVSHLADGNGRVSPRSFQIAIRTAAEDSLMKKGEYPLHYECIKKGVQEASQNRIEEIQEDRPWVSELMVPLQKLIVPLDFSIIEKQWETRFPNGFQYDYETKKCLPPPNIEKSWIGIKSDLIGLGIFTGLQDGRINMPDLYRVGFKLGRKGGVKPVK